MIHDFDFTESGDERAVMSLEAFFALLRKWANDPTVRLVSVAEAAAGGDWSARRLYWNGALQKWRMLRAIGHKSDALVYLPTAEARSTCLLVAGQVSLILIALVSATVGCSVWLRARMPPVHLALAGVAVVLCTAFTVAAARRGVGFSDLRTPLLCALFSLLLAVYVAAGWDKLRRRLSRRATAMADQLDDGMPLVRRPSERER